jgi:nitroreductase
MEIPFSRWYPAIRVRKSRRQYDPSAPVPAEKIESLEKVCDQFRPFKGARAVFLEGDVDNIFTGFIGSYGKIKGASCAIVFVGDENEKYFQESVGFTGEGIVLEATALGLGTCWVGGSFNAGKVAKRVQLKAGEKVLAVTPVGIVPGLKTTEEKLASGFARSRMRKPLHSMVSGVPEERWQDWARTALESARLAPSGVNMQPWLFRVEPDAIVVSHLTGLISRLTSARLNCGIAMLHIEIAALAGGVSGTWEFLESPEVARFKASKSTAA